ncbi:IclR family transcriptional regulator [Marinimicrococcus flavescens]|uniref:IclR family transcriptional regulator n=1 Tax=Marinimicrococcus flavescens TaxID=3031815 RepID=A0AAP3XPQ2_9PROT|nr:IclR family transcriptional regulator [Marinimicrococcus flavescens]
MSKIVSGAGRVKSLAKAASLLDCFGRDSRAMTLAELAEQAGLPKPTAHQHLVTLKELGFVEQDVKGDRYRLGIRLFQLGSLYLANLELGREAQPVVDRLARITGETVHLSIFDGLYAVMVDRRESDSGPYQMVMNIEGAPAYCTGVGKAMLAFQPDAAVERVIAAGLVRFTERTITEAGELRADLARVRDRGFAIDDDEHQFGQRCVAAPIRNAAGQVFAAISVAAPAARVPDSRIEVLGELVVQSAETIARRLGWHG